MFALDKAIKAAGSTRKLSIALGVTSMSVSHWKNRDQWIVPPSYIFPIFKMIDVTPHEMRPDLYPNPTDGFASFVFSGAPVTEKNHLAAAIGNHLLALGHSVLVVTIPDLMLRVRECYDDGQSESACARCSC